MNKEYMEMKADRSREIRDVFNLPTYENLEEFADEMLDAEERRLKEGKAVHGNDHTYENMLTLQHSGDNPAGAEAGYEVMDAPSQEVKVPTEKDGEGELCIEKEKHMEQNSYDEENVQDREEMERIVEGDQEKVKKW